MEKPSRGGEKRTAVWASHPEDRGSDEVIAPPCVTTGWSRIAGECVSGATPRGQPRMPAMRLPHGCEGLRVWRRTVWWTFRRPFMGRPVPRQLLRNELLDVTTIVPATAYHRRSYTRDTVGVSRTIANYVVKSGRESEVES